MQGIFKTCAKSIRYLLAALFLVSGSLAKLPQTDWNSYQKSGHKSAKWDPLVKAGFEAFDGENFGAALSFLKRAEALGCDDGLVIYKQSAYQELQGNFNGAVVLLKKAEPLLNKNYPSHPATKEFNDHLGGLYYQTAQYDEALARYLAAIQSLGEDFLRDYLVGQMYRMKGKAEEAIGYFEKALRFQPPAGSPPNMQLFAMVELLKLYEATHQDQKALPMAEQILAIDPANSPALSVQGRIQHRQFKQKEKEKWKDILEKY